MQFLFNMGKGFFWLAVALGKAALWTIVVLSWISDTPRRPSDDDDDDDDSFFRHWQEGKLE